MEPVTTLLLYHFTTRESLSRILAKGLRLGRVPTSPTTILEAVWLPTDPGPGGHGVEASGPLMSDEQRRQAHEWTGVLPPAGTRFAREAKVRITVELDPGDRALEEWLP